MNRILPSQDVRNEFNRRQSIEIIPKRKWKQRAEAEEGYNLKTVLPDRFVDGQKLFVSFHQFENPFTRKISCNEKGNGRGHLQQLAGRH